MSTFSRIFVQARMLMLFLTAVPGFAQAGSIHGTVVDPSGAAIPKATVELIENDKMVANAATDASGHYQLDRSFTGRAYLRVSAAGFRTVEQILKSSATDLTEDIALPLASFDEQVTVTSTGTPTPQAQLGSTVTVLTQPDYEDTRDLLEALPAVPGLQVTETGRAGGTTSLFIRGGASDANKLLIDGIPANDIGGGVEFANFASAGIASTEVLRGPNSALYGSDALAGVVSLTTPRGSTPMPVATYLAEGGNFSTYQQEGTLSGTYRKTDYFSDYSRFDTGNALPGNAFHDGTFAGSYGWGLSPNTSIRATVRHDQVASGQPSAIDLYGIPDDTKQSNEDAYFGVTLENQTRPNWHNLVRYGGIRLRSLFTDFAPTGIPQYADFTENPPNLNCDPQTDPNCLLLDYLGAPMTIRGANGYTVNGQAQFQFPNTYPNFYPTSTDKDFVYGQSDYRVSPHLLGLFGFRYEDERGYSGGPGPASSIERGNYSYTLEVQGDIRNRLFYTVGSGLEDNGLFGFAATPRASLAWQLTDGSRSGLFAGTKLRASFGKGIKEPALFDQLDSLHALLQGIPDGNQLITQYNIAPIGPQQSRAYDGGVDQSLAGGKGRFSVTFFHNEFTNGIEFIPQQGLIELGVPLAVVDAAPFGATVNSQAYRSQGVEAETEFSLSHDISARGGYTYVDATIQHSFTSDAIGPSSNPNFSTIPIGVFSPLVGARPFRIAPHTGYFQISYRHRKFFTNLRGTLVGSRDDSDFLEFDANGEPSLLLPNRNLDGAYQNLDLSGSYQANSYVAVTGSFQNILCEHYSEAFGYPSLPFTFRMGMKFTLGGEAWPRN
jgi:iron complex outermembrane receptor protein/vitamin B12 transporter